MKVLIPIIVPKPIMQGGIIAVNEDNKGRRLTHQERWHVHNDLKAAMTENRDGDWRTFLELDTETKSVTVVRNVRVSL